MIPLVALQVATISLALASVVDAASTALSRRQVRQHLWGRDTVYHSSSAYEDGEYGKGPNQTFHSAPDLHPPVLNIRTSPLSSDLLQEGYIFLGINSKLDDPQSGLAIYDNNGTLIYFAPQYGRTMHFRPQIFQGEAVLTFYDGDSFSAGYGELCSRTRRWCSDARHHHSLSFCALLPSISTGKGANFLMDSTYTVIGNVTW